MDEKRCLHCQMLLSKKYYESRTAWEGRKFCSRACHYAYSRAHPRPAWNRGATAATDSRLEQMVKNKLAGHRSRGERITKQCPICGSDFEIAASQTRLLITCRSAACKATYRKVVVNDKIGRASRAAVAAGRVSHGWTTRGPSRAEQLLAQLLEPHGWVAECPVLDETHPQGRVATCDVAWAEQRLDVEIDGSSHRKKHGHDAERDTQLRLKGWEVLRVTDTTVLENPQGTANAVLLWAKQVISARRT